jgi:hypothetical protein
MASALVSELDLFIDFLEKDPRTKRKEFNKILRAIDVVQNAIEEKGF